MQAPKGLAMPGQQQLARSRPQLVPKPGFCLPSTSAAHSLTVNHLRYALRRTQLSCARPEQSRNLESTSADEPIADYIFNNCPSPGINGQYREKVLDPTFEAVCLPQPSNQYLCPGARISLQLPPAASERVLQQSQVVLAQFEESNGMLVPKVSPRGSTAALALVTGVQRLGETVLASVRVQERISIQAVSSSPNTGLVLVRGASLLDRWVYCVRASAVAELSAWPGSRTSAEVTTTLANLEDVQADLYALLQELGALTTKFTQDPHNEWQDLLEWMSAGPVAQASHSSRANGESSTGSPSSPKTPDPLAVLQRATRLSFAVFAAAATPLMLGISAEELGSKRSQAMGQTDIGRRSEDAIEFAELLRNLLCAKLALGGV